MEIKTDTKNHFQTDDILIASFLLCNQARFHNIISDRSQHFVFIFEDINKCEELVRNYLNNGQTSARELFARRKELITVMRHRNGNKYGAYK